MPDRFKDCSIAGEEGLDVIVQLTQIARDLTD
jgi:hypothetical protein